MTVDSSVLQSRALRFGSVAVRCARTTAQPTQSSYIRWRKNILGRPVLRRRFVLWARHLLMRLCFHSPSYSVLGMAWLCAAGLRRDVE